MIGIDDYPVGTGARVARVLIDDQRATGVELADGSVEQIGRAHV